MDIDNIEKSKRRHQTPTLTEKETVAMKVNMVAIILAMFLFSTFGFGGQKLINGQIHDKGAVNWVWGETVVQTIDVGILSYLENDVGDFFWRPQLVSDMAFVGLPPDLGGLTNYEFLQITTFGTLFIFDHEPWLVYEDHPAVATNSFLYYWRHGQVEEVYSDIPLKVELIGYGRKMVDGVWTNVNFDFNSQSFAKMAPYVIINGQMYFINSGHLDGYLNGVKMNVNADGTYGLTSGFERSVGKARDYNDYDSDGLFNNQELDCGSSFDDSDSDDDGYNDGAEVNIYGTSPVLADTDNDRLTDSAEIDIYLTNPLNKDTDGDGLTDGEEIAGGSDPLTPENFDTDGDGLYDNTENDLGTDPNNPDTDGDGLTDGEEVMEYLTNPLRSDTDGDGINDGDEIASGSDPFHGEITIRVPEDYVTIQEAIDSVTLRDSYVTILIGPGTYAGFVLEDSMGYPPAEGYPGNFFRFTGSSTLNTLIVNQGDGRSTISVRLGKGSVSITNLTVARLVSDNEAQSFQLLQFGMTGPAIAMGVDIEAEIKDCIVFSQADGLFSVADNTKLENNLFIGDFARWCSPCGLNLYSGQVYMRDNVVYGFSVGIEYSTAPTLDLDEDNTYIVKWGHEASIRMGNSNAPHAFWWFLNGREEVFPNRNKFDFRLSENSPLIGAGVDGGNIGLSDPSRGGPILPLQELLFAKIELKYGWNLVAFPEGASEMSLGDVLSGSVLAVWEWSTEGGYVIPERIKPLKPYWIFASADCSISYRR